MIVAPIDYKPLIDRFVERVTSALGGELVSVVLYGSVARDEAGPRSDVDVLIVLEDPPASYRARLDPFLPILEQMRDEPAWHSMEATGIHPVLSTLILSRSEADQNRLIYLDMIEDAQILFDRDGFFAARLSKLAQRLEELGARKVRQNGGWYWDLKPGAAIGETVIL